MRLLIALLMLAAFLAALITLMVMGVLWIGSWYYDRRGQAEAVTLSDGDVAEYQNFVSETRVW
ncbi:MAG: hypothetical protein JNL58_08180 [Planctomyces sp.]|nr:hypothetical protein [Planctomyces sp.]